MTFVLDAVTVPAVIAFAPVHPGLNVRSLAPLELYTAMPAL